MLKVLTVLTGALLVAGCLATERLKPEGNGVWIGVKDTSYEKVWNAANTVMARHLVITESDSEAGRIDGTNSKGGKLWNEAVAFFVWPTENSDAGYMVDVDFGQIRPVLRGNEIDWQKTIVDELKKELGGS